MKLFVAVFLAVLGAGALTVHAQLDGEDGPPNPYLKRFIVVASETISDGRLTVIRDTKIPNQPCFYLFQSAYGTQMMPTPGGVC